MHSTPAQFLARRGPTVCPLFPLPFEQGLAVFLALSRSQNAGFAQAGQPRRDPGLLPPPSTNKELPGAGEVDGVRHLSGRFRFREIARRASHSEGRKRRQGHVFQNCHDGMMASLYTTGRGAGCSLRAVRQDTSCCDLRRSNPENSRRIRMTPRRRNVSRDHGDSDARGVDPARHRGTPYRG
jgi:hypothetical protein